jgi:hypothetical protein
MDGPWRFASTLSIFLSETFLKHWPLCGLLLFVLALFAYMPLFWRFKEFILCVR